MRTPTAFPFSVSVCVTVVFGAARTSEKQEGIRLELLQQVITQAGCNLSRRERPWCAWELASTCEETRIDRLEFTVVPSSGQS